VSLPPCSHARAVEREDVSSREVVAILQSQA
jgi:hypothetical protein